MRILIVEQSRKQTAFYAKLIESTLGKGVVINQQKRLPSDNAIRACDLIILNNLRVSTQSVCSLVCYNHEVAASSVSQLRKRGVSTPAIIVSGDLHGRACFSSAPPSNTVWMHKPFMASAFKKYVQMGIASGFPFSMIVDTESAFDRTMSRINDSLDTARRQLQQQSANFSYHMRKIRQEVPEWVPGTRLVVLEGQREEERATARA